MGWRPRSDRLESDCRQLTLLHTGNLFEAIVAHTTTGKVFVVIWVNLGGGGGARSDRLVRDCEQMTLFHTGNLFEAIVAHTTTAWKVFVVNWVN